MRKQQKKRDNFNHLTPAKRDRLEIMLKAGDKQKTIAEVLKVDPSTVSREKGRKRKKDLHYDATIAQAKAKAKRASSKYCGMAVESDLLRKNYIIAELKKHRSPDEIAGRIKKENIYKKIGTDAIYRWLYGTRGGRYATLLCTRRRKRKKQKRSAKREMIPNRISLKERPKEGIHAEGDTFVSPKNTGTESGAIIVIPDSQLILATKASSLSPVVVCPIFSSLLGETTATDITLDNGIENKGHETFPVPAYFCEAHHPWEKPHVENSIGLLRRWFLPKGMNMGLVEEARLQSHVHVLNGKYRKSLGYRSAYEVSLERGIIQKDFVEKKRLLAENYVATKIALGVRI